MPVPDSAAVAACKAMPRSVNSATIWVSVPLIAMTSRKKAIPRPQNSHERNASATPAPGRSSAAPRDWPRSGRMAKSGGSRTNSATGIKASTTTAMAMPT
jgi:hypothetical protein